MSWKRLRNVMTVPSGGPPTLTSAPPTRKSSSQSDAANLSSEDRDPQDDVFVSPLGK